MGFTGKSKFIYLVLSELDEDNSGGIDFKEFLNLATSKPNEKDTMKQIEKIFKMYDWNKEGTSINIILRKNHLGWIKEGCNGFGRGYDWRWNHVHVQKGNI